MTTPTYTSPDYNSMWAAQGSGANPNPTFGAPYAQNTDYSTYSKPLLTSAASSSSSSGAWNPSDYLAAAQLIYGAYQNKQAQNRASQPPKFIEAPQTDQEKKLWDLFYAQQTGPTANNRALVSGYAQDMLANSHPEWTPPKTSTGETGYNGTAGMKWPSVPAFDWSGYTGKGGMPGPTAASGPPGGGGGAPGSDVNPRDGLGGVGARAGIGSDTTTPAGGGGVDPHLSIGGTGLTGSTGSSSDGVDLPTLQKYGPTAKQLIDKYGKYAVTAAGMIGGPEAGLLTKVVTWILGKVLPSGAQTPPTDANGQPSTLPTHQPRIGLTDLAPSGTDPRLPANGSVGSLDDLFQPTDAANAQQGYDFWNNLMNASGQDPTDQFSYHVNTGRKR